MITVKVLGPGCANCRAVEAAAREAVASLSMQADIIKVQNRDDINQYRILSTPGLVINEKVVCAGRIPSVAEVTTWLADAAMQES
jgi:small redox-active disulfide protein 2